MRHGKSHNHLGRKTAHRHALMSNMANALILNKRMVTTVAKAKALRIYVEPLITKSKEDNTHNRRIVFSYLKEKEAIKELFGIIAEKVGDRPGGYTRIIKLPNRLGDNAEMCMMELVDFNETMLAAVEEKAVKTRRSKRGTGTAKAATASTAAVVTEEPSAEVVEDVKVEAATEVESPATEEAAPEAPATDEKPTE